MKAMGLRTALLFASFDRRCGSLPAREDATRMKLVSEIVDRVVLFEIDRIRRFDSQAKERKLKRSIEEGIRYVIAAGKPGYQASIEDLQELGCRVVGGPNSGFRVADPEPGQRPLLPARSIPGALTRLFDWLQSPAFAEMHPVEQMTVCQARLFEVAPFPILNDTITGFFSYLFPWSRLGLLPLFESHELGPFYAALQDAVSLETGPLVEMNLRACERTCGLLTEGR